MASRRFLVAVSGAEIYVAADSLRSDRRKRTKDSIATVRHLYLDFDLDGEARPPSLRTSDTLPTPTAVFSTSLGKYQILCRIDSVTLEQQQSTLKLLAIPFGGDPACMGCNWVLRLPGFRNCKHDPSYPITVKYPSDSTSNPASNPSDFRLDIPAAEALPLPHAIPSRKQPGKHTNSEHDWTWILHELAHGKDAAKLTRMIASRRSDKPRPLYLRLFTSSGWSMSRRRDLASSKAFRWRTFVTLLVVRRRSEIASARCIRKGPSKDAVEPPAKKLTAGVESTASVRVLKACYCIQFCGNAETVLRTGRILTLHPWEGTVGKPGLALGEPSLHPIDSVGGGSVRKPVYTCVNAGVGKAGSNGAAQ